MGSCPGSLGGVVSAIAGGVLAAGDANSMVSLLGLLAVAAIAARHAIALFDRYRWLEEQPGMAVNVDLVVRGASERLPALVSSSAGIAAALLPMVVLGNAAGLEIAHSISMVVIAGTAVSALISSLVLPPLYLLVRSKVQRAPDLGRM